MINKNRKIKPGPGQESVWDYPRPPKLEKSDSQIKVIFNGETIAETRGAYRVLETSHPPVYYIPQEDIKEGVLEPTSKTTFCEWKGIAKYFTVQVGEKSSGNAAWTYRDPTEDFRRIKDYVAFYPDKMDACYVDGEEVKAQEGSFYGGWITNDIVGPFKGERGTENW